MPWSPFKLVALPDNRPKSLDERLMHSVASLHAAAVRGRERDAPVLAKRATELLRRSAAVGDPFPSRPRAVNAQ